MASVSIRAVWSCRLALAGLFLTPVGWLVCWLAIEQLSFDWQIIPVFVMRNGLQLLLAMSALVLGLRGLQDTHATRDPLGGGRRAMCGVVVGGVGVFVELLAALTFFLVL